uniref:LADLIDADG maturase/endonuclease-like protein n=1 Tax=Ogataea parapolymorpha (strain ATCC 26012 / BCRC 20466 / JCM 22074 / NRRL Y-7560 / DL-1) TaxID=871575 RepID=E7E825_OGAPD|nr:LADLIDADG maturase/endonuclease-like protein [Ogataea polymorpha]ADT63556.1 LADLIDADG maturase/endonuclease-like protein [Ogataea polymorpha]
MSFINNNSFKYYVCGIIQTNGLIGIKLRKTSNKSILLMPYFNITLNSEHKDLILNIKTLFNNVGYIKYNNKTIKYEVNQLNQTKDVIVPFLLKYDLKSYKHKKVILFNTILEIMSLNQHKKNINILLSLMMLSNNISKLNNKYLNKEQQYIVNNKIIDPSINKYMTQLNYKLDNYKPSDMNIHYINGMFDTSGSLNVNLDLNKDLKIIYSMTQDSTEIKLLNNILLFFNCTGKMSYLNNKTIKLSIFDFNEIKNNVLVKLENNLPLMKGYKFKYTNNVLMYINNNKDYRTNNMKIIKMIKMLYKMIENKKNMSEEEYIKKVTNKK